MMFILERGEEGMIPQIRNRSRPPFRPTMLVSWSEPLTQSPVAVAFATGKGRAKRKWETRWASYFWNKSCRKNEWLHVQIFYLRELMNVLNYKLTRYYRRIYHTSWYITHNPSVSLKSLRATILSISFCRIMTPTYPSNASTFFRINTVATTTNQPQTQFLQPS